jgi:hypothetical protein
MNKSLHILSLGFVAITLVGCANNAVEPEMTAEQNTAYEKCEAVNGTPRIVMSELHGGLQVFCTFSDGECTQGELNTDECFMQKK